MTPIKVGDLDVMHSGTVLTIENTPVQLVIGNEPDPLVFRFAFADDATTPEFKTVSSVNGKVMEVTLVNSGAGAATHSFVEIGTASDRVLYYGFSLTSEGQPRVRVLHYQFLLGRPVEKEG